MEFCGTVLGHSHIASLTCPQRTACLVGLHSDPALLDLIVNLCLAFCGTVLGHSHIASLTCPQCTACLVGLHSDPALLDLIVNSCPANTMDFCSIVLGHSHIDRASSRLVLSTQMDKRTETKCSVCAAALVRASQVDRL